MAGEIWPGRIILILKNRQRIQELKLDLDDIVAKIILSFPRPIDLKEAEYLLEHLAKELPANISYLPLQHTSMLRFAIMPNYELSDYNPENIKREVRNAVTKYFKEYPVRKKTQS